MDVAIVDDQMRARTGQVAHNLAVLKHITLNLIRLDPVPRKGGIKPDASSSQLPISIAFTTRLGRTFMP